MMDVCQGHYANDMVKVIGSILCFYKKNLARNLICLYKLTSTFFALFTAFLRAKPITLTIKGSFFRVRQHDREVTIHYLELDINS